MLNHRIEEGEGATTLHLSGDLTITHGEELRALLAVAVITFDRLVLRLGELNGLDLSALQVLCAAHRVASEQGRAVSLEGTGSEVFQGTLEKGGFLRHVGCLCDTAGTCFWMKGVSHG